MKRSATILTIAACAGLCALVWAQGTKGENVPIPTKAPAVSASVTAAAQRGNSVCDSNDAPEAYTPTLPIQVPARKAGNGAEEEKSTAPPEQQAEASAPTPAPQPAEEAPAPSQPPAPAPQAEPASPKMGDTRTVDGQKQVYFLGFGWIEDSDEPNTAIYVEDMYENGNKVGSMGGGTVVDGDGDINKMVGIMGE